jgi:hypothetical protein
LRKFFFWKEIHQDQSLQLSLFEELKVDSDVSFHLHVLFCKPVAGMSMEINGKSFRKLPFFRKLSGNFPETFLMEINGNFNGN